LPTPTAHVGTELAKRRGQYRVNFAEERGVFRGPHANKADFCKVLRRAV
jgi:hypothetical protein